MRPTKNKLWKWLKSLVRRIRSSTSFFRGINHPIWGFREPLGYLFLFRKSLKDLQAKLMIRFKKFHLLRHITEDQQAMQAFQQEATHLVVGVLQAGTHQFHQSTLILYSLHPRSHICRPHLQQQCANPQKDTNTAKTISDF